MYASPEVIRYLDELTRADLQNLRDSYFFWLLISSGVVALGVVLEGPEIVHETVGIIRRSSGPERKTPSWITWLALVGWLFVVLGLAGEGIAEALVSQGDGLIQTFNDIVLTDAQREITRAEEQAGEAKASAANAADAADRANKSAEKADEHAGKANVMAQMATAQAAQLKAIAETLRNEAETERLARIRLQEAVTPREVGTDGEQNAELELFAGMKVAITFATDAETRDLTGNIIGVLKRARWDVLNATPESPLFSNLEPLKIIGAEHLKLAMITSALHDGVSVISKPDGVARPSNEAARMLSYILKDNGVGCSTWPMIFQGRHWPKEIPDDAMQILVGRKPTAYLKWAENPEAQEAFIKMEKDSETMSEDDKRDRERIRTQYQKQKNPN